MKYYSITLFLLGSTFLFAQTNTAVLYLNDTSTNGIQATGNTANGQYSFAIGHENQATGFGSVSLASSSVSSGIASVAIGDRVTASGDYGSTAIGLLTTASGNSSFAGGDNTTSSGAYSFAFGENSISSGGTSVAFGFGTESSGLYSTSFGVNSNADGNTSAAMGYGTIASDYGSLVVGVNNLSGSTVTSDADNLDLSNTAFVIGNGLDESNRSDALVVKFDGTTTIAGIVNASSFVGNGSGLTNLPLVVESITEAGNTGVRLSSANANLYGDIGNNALDLTFSNTGTDVSSGATGDSSVALGENTTASGTFSTAIGVGSQATGQGSTALGSGNIASGNYSTVSGFENVASGNSSFAGGDNTTSSGAYSFAFGENSISSGGTSVAFGFGTESSGLYSTSFGVNSNADGNTSAAMGYGTIASDYGSLVVGVNNLSGSTVTSDADNLDLSNTAFVIGNGLDESNRSDALVVKFDGTTTIAGDLNVNSDARLKANIVSLGSTLAKLLQIEGKSYTMKKDENKKRKIGVLAQDIEKVFPELVSEISGVKSVNYQGLVPVLINAMKEQQRILTEQQSELDELKSMMKKIIEKP